MKPIDFLHSNAILGAPDGMESECIPLHAYDTGDSFISCWKLDPDDIEKVKNGEPIWLVVYGRGHPPVFLGTDNPFI
jgi:hypothetical protein